MNLDEGISLRKHPFLHALRHWGRFVRRNVCAKRPRGEERGETDVFPGYQSSSLYSLEIKRFARAEVELTRG